MRRRLIFIAPLALLGMVLFVTIGGEIVMHLWNWLLPPLFGWRQITFWQALAGSCSEAFVSPVLIAPLFGSEWPRAGKP